MKIIELVFFWLLSLLSLSISHLVQTNAGTYRGSILKSWKNSSFLGFEGIKYARPPINNLRFKDPVLLNDNFSYIYNATKSGNDCPSIYANNPSEDCLFLNIYKKIQYPLNNRSVPVIVFIHPGGLYVGSSARAVLGPDYLLEKDIVLVTFNYRLGTLGFLNLNSPEYPGNSGFKDQVIALKWINKNIAHFGGDPNQITLMGYSAGALSVTLHLVSPLSRGLFHKAIIMSGSVPPQLNIMNDQTHLAFRQYNVLGCNCTDIKDIITCLNNYSGDEIAATLRKMFDFGKDNPVFLWQPIIENILLQNRFLEEDPYTSIRNGNFEKVPILIGFTENELCGSSEEIMRNSQLLKDLNDKFEELFPTCFMYNNRSSAHNETQQIREFYFNSQLLTLDSFSKLCDLFSDAIIKFGSSRLANLASEYVDIFTYKFSFKGTYSHLYYPDDNTVNGVEHLDDLMYIFRSGPVTFTPAHKEAHMVELMTNMISTFATKGKPTDELMWAPGILHFGHITDNITIKMGSFFDNYNFWNSVFPL